MIHASQLSILTKKMIDELHMLDLHVHLPGTIKPETAWQLGLNNNLIEIQKKNEKFSAIPGSQKLSSRDSFENYLDVFSDDFIFSVNGQVKNLKYKLSQEKKFKSFDAIMATVQGHRHPPGGIQSIDDICYVFDKFLEDCIDQKIIYVEMQQNIKIAYLLYPDLDKAKARRELFKLFENISNKFTSNGITLKFLHCFNKTSAAGEAMSTQQRTIEAAEWLKDAQEHTPGLFVGLESAGHEKDQSGWPIHLKDGYKMVHKMGLGCEAHGGEGIGVEHMMDVAQTLPITRMAHGFQVIEDQAAINYVKEKDLTLIMTPIVNLNLGMCIHAKQTEGNTVPCGKTKGGTKLVITELHHHPFFELFRKHKLKVTIGSDNPNLGGVPLKRVIKALAGLDDEYTLPENFNTLKAEELAIICENSINVIFSDQKTKDTLKQKLSSWIAKNNLKQSYIENFYN
jgi:adenosine deaminase